MSYSQGEILYFCQQSWDNYPGYDFGQAQPWHDAGMQADNPSFDTRLAPYDSVVPASIEQGYSTHQAPAPSHQPLGVVPADAQGNDCQTLSHRDNWGVNAQESMWTPPGVLTGHQDIPDSSSYRATPVPYRGTDGPYMATDSDPTQGHESNAKAVDEAFTEAFSALKIVNVERADQASHPDPSNPALRQCRWEHCSAFIPEDRSVLSRHLQIAHGVDLRTKGAPTPCLWAGCKSKTLRAESVSRHCLSARGHLSERRYRCIFCERTYRRQDVMIRHAKFCSFNPSLINPPLRRKPRRNYKNPELENRSWTFSMLHRNRTTRRDEGHRMPVAKKFPDGN